MVTSDSRPTVVALVGPTGSGKTALSLALSGSLPLEIVSCDSRTVYRYMDIGTAKASPAEQQAVPHHLLDVVSPTEVYTAIQYKNAGTEAIERILSRGRLPLICGGTGFYARVLLEGFDVPQVPPQPELRASLRALADENGNQCLHDKLNEVDPISAARINVNDRFRLVRALEVTVTTGRPFSQVAARKQPPYRTVWVGLTAADRSSLYAIIGKRLELQRQEGMVQEVEGLLQRFGPTQTLMNTINYREVIAYLQGQMDLEQALQDCYRHNCQLARRQLIWFRANKDIRWFEIDQMSHDELKNNVLSYVQSELMH